MSDKPSGIRRGFDAVVQMRHEPAFKSGILSVFIQVAMLLMRLAASVLLARLLGASGYGSYSFVYAIVLLVNIVPSSGLENTVIRFSSQYLSSGRVGLLRGLLNRSFIATIGYGVTAALVAFLVSWLHVFPGTGAFSPVVLFAAIVPLLFLPIVSVVSGMLRALHPGVVGQLPQYLFVPLIFLVFLACFIVFGHETSLSASLAIVGQGLAALCASAFALFWLIKHSPVSMWSSSPGYEMKRWAKTTVPLALMGGLTMINLQLDILLLGGMTTAHETGLYKVAAQGGSIVALAVMGVNLFIAPRVARLYSQGKIERLQRLVSLSIHGAFAFALAVSIVFWLEGGQLLKLIFGDEYGAAYLILAILCVGQLINVGTGSAGTILNMTGYERDALFITVGAVCVNVVLNVILIPYFAGVGAALATTSTMLLWKMALAYKVWRRTGLVTCVLVPFGRRPSQ